ncbi:MAG: DUF2550 domain-containing protein [Mycobacteriales bacterium]
MSAAQVLLSLAVLVVLVVGAGLLRRVGLQRAGGTIELSLRLKAPGHGRGWVNGVGRFVDDELLWYRVFSLAPRPRRRYSRRSLQVVRRREPSGGEHRALLQGAAVLECQVQGQPVELAMSCAAVTGFLAWLEARPPGATLPV